MVDWNTNEYPHLHMVVCNRVSRCRQPILSWTQHEGIAGIGRMSHVYMWFMGSSWVNMYEWEVSATGRVHVRIGVNLDVRIGLSKSNYQRNHTTKWTSRCCLWTNLHGHCTPRQMTNWKVMIGERRLVRGLRSHGRHWWEVGCSQIQNPLQYISCDGIVVYIW